MPPVTCARLATCGLRRVAAAASLRRRPLPWRPTAGLVAPALLHLRKLAQAQAQRLEEGADEAASALTLRWGCRLSVVLHWANAETLRTCEGKEATRWKDLAADLAD